MNLENHVKLRAAELGISMTDVSKRMSMKYPGQLYQVFRYKKPHTQTIARLAQALEMSSNDIFLWTEQTNKFDVA